MQPPSWKSRTMPYHYFAHSVYDQLGDPYSELCQKALEHECELCGAPAQEWCTQLTHGYPLLHHRVHYMRSQEGINP